MDPFIGEIKMTSFNWAPKGWALCDGAILQTSQNAALFSLLGNRYGGDGKTTFALPDLRGRTPMHTDFQYYPIGVAGGAETATLDQTTMPAHTHTFQATSAAATLVSVASNAQQLPALSQQNLYAAAASLTPMSPQSCSSTGGGNSHPNMQPSLVVNFIIALVGIWPPRN